MSKSWLPRIWHTKNEVWGTSREQDDLSGPAARRRSGEEAALFAGLQVTGAGEVSEPHGPEIMSEAVTGVKPSSNWRAGNRRGGETEARGFNSHQRCPLGLGDCRRLWAGAPLCCMCEECAEPWARGPWSTCRPQLSIWAEFPARTETWGLSLALILTGWYVWIRGALFISGDPVLVGLPVGREWAYLPSPWRACLFSTQIPKCRQASPVVPACASHLERLWCCYPFCSLCTHQNKQTETQTHPSRLIVRELAPMLAQPDEFR